VKIICDTQMLTLQKATMSGTGHAMHVGNLMCRQNCITHQEIS